MAGGNTVKIGWMVDLLLGNTVIGRSDLFVLFIVVEDVKFWHVTLTIHICMRIFIRSKIYFKQQICLKTSPSTSGSLSCLWGQSTKILIPFSPNCTQPSQRNVYAKRRTDWWRKESRKYWAFNRCGVGVCHDIVPPCVAMRLIAFFLSRVPTAICLIMTQ